MPGPSEPRVPRRRFLKTIGLAGVSAAVAPVTLSLAQTAPGAATAAKPDSAAAKPDSMQAAVAKPPEISEDAKALAAIITRRYGEDLTKEQLESVAKDFDGDLKSGKRLRDVNLANGDEPDFTFRA
ncbi:MAG: hypothetical protein HZC42_14670 [Candidatus Eisenbacteria bacterium]|nr:hypothetical protein [Candidatus Eisenbacteria bacterium]